MKHYLELIKFKKNIDEIDNKLTYNSYFDEKYNNTLSYKLNKQLLKLKI